MLDFNHILDQHIQLRNHFFYIRTTVIHYESNMNLQYYGNVSQINDLTLVLISQKILDKSQKFERLKSERKKKNCKW